MKKKTDIAYASRKLLEAVASYKNILILIKGSPDPDVIASSLALRAICSRLGIKSRITALAELSLPQNRAIVKKLHIPLHVDKVLKHDAGFDAYAVLDFQSARVQELAGKIPCVLHIDHHEPVDEDLPVDFKLLSEEAGSVSTIMALILREMGPFQDDQLQTQVSTALFFGIHSDTDRYQHAGPLDYEALEYLSGYTDRDIINNILNLPLSDEMMKFLGTAARNKEIYRDWLITGIGYLDESSRDHIALIADYLLQREEVDTVFVFALILKNNQKNLVLDASIRTRDEKLDLNALIRALPVGGGARTYKGAFQVGMDFFARCPDKNIVWEAVRTTSHDLIKTIRDEMPLLELKGFYTRIKKTISGIFR